MISTLKPLKSEEYISLAKRPKFSLLDIKQTSDLLEMKPLDWRENLEYILRDYKRLNY